MNPVSCICAFLHVIDRNNIKLLVSSVLNKEKWALKLNKIIIIDFSKSGFNFQFLRENYTTEKNIKLIKIDRRSN